MRKSTCSSTSSESFQSSSENGRKSHGSGQDARGKGTYRQYKDRDYNHTRVDFQNHPIKAPVFKEYITDPEKAEKTGNQIYPPNVNAKIVQPRGICTFNPTHVVAYDTVLPFTR
ncbi:hypothetical protein WR25_22702 isoform C [Diploscapter pachys]|uniref:Uncharacterized protein n=1 Tax=Diploscapter pachys TaxID=2018661 RepID=A0A2A2M105_9BILA|nr:hypothetical protein WR25_22702 isoform C [Diploscapter pachys]